MPNLSATVFPAEAYVLLQADWSGTVIMDGFNRTNSPGFGIAPTGQAWSSLNGAATDYFTGAVGPGFGATISNGSVNVLRHALIPFGFNDFDIRVEGFTFGADIALTSPINLFVTGRYLDSNNYYNVQLRLNTAGAVQIFLSKRIAGVLTTVGSTVTLASVNAADTRWNIRFRGVGNQFHAKAWLTGTVAPTADQVSITDTDLAAGTGVGLLARLEGGNTNPLPVLFTFDSFQVINPDATTSDYSTVTRRNTVTGETVALRPYAAYNANGALLLECGLGLWWDTEPPLNVPLEYCTSAVGIPVPLSQTATFETGVAPWTVTGGTFVQDCAVAKVGSCSGVLTPTGTAADPRISQTGFALVANRETTATAWVRSSQGWNGVRLLLSVVYTDATVETVSTPVEILDDLEWRYLSVTFTPRTTTSSVTLSMVALGTPAGSNLFHVDEIQVTYKETGAETARQTVTVPSSNTAWLKNPLHPCLDVQVGLDNPILGDCGENSGVSFAGMGEASYPANTVVLSSTNRRHPIPISRVRRDAENVLRLITHDCEARDAVLAANLPGDPLLWQSPPEYCIADRYITVGTVTEQHISVDQREEFRLMALPHVAVDRPQGPADGVCGAQIADLCDIYTSWGAMTIANLSWAGLLLGEASPNGPGQPAPPAAARTWDDVNSGFADWTAVEAGGTRDWDELRDGL